MRWVLSSEAVDCGGVWLCICSDCMSRLDNNSLIVVRGAGSGHSELQEYHEVSTLNLLQSVCNRTSNGPSDETNRLRGCYVWYFKTPYWLYVKCQDLINNSLVQLGGAEQNCTFAGILSLSTALLSAPVVLCPFWSSRAIYLRHISSRQKCMKYKTWFDDD